MEASRIACPSSWSRATSAATEPSGRSVASRWSSSSWRTVPTRQGTHWPHDSSRKNWAMRRRIWRRSTVSSNGITTAEPSVAPAARVPSKVSGMSSWSGPTKAPAAPPSSTACRRAAAADAAGQVEQLPQGDAEGRLVDAGALDVAGEAEELGAGRALGADGGEGLPPLDHDGEHVDQGLDVVDHRRLAEQAGLGGERRLVARLAAAPLQRVHQRRLLAADVGAGAAPQLDVEAHAVAEDVVAEEAAVAAALRWRSRSAPGPADTRRAGRGSPCSQPVAKPAIVIASISAKGSCSISTRSLKVPGSDSSALQIR